MSSEAVNDDFEIFVHLPLGYEGNAERYPAVYQLDGQEQSEPVAGMAEDLGIPIIVVGVGYAKGREINRVRDYYATPDERLFEVSGRADLFLRFLEAELIPRIDGKYRTTSRRTLMGHSAGGAAVFFTLFNQNADVPVFDSLAAISPNFAWDFGAMFDIEEEHAKTATDLKVRLLVAVGEVEIPHIVMYTRAMIKRLEGRAYPSLDLETRALAGANHRLTWFDAYPMALERFHGD